MLRCRDHEGSPISPLQGLPAEIDELQKVTLRLFEEKVFQPRTAHGQHTPDDSSNILSEVTFQNIPFSSG